MIRVAFDREFAPDLFERIMMNQLVHALRGAGEPVVDGGDGSDDLAENAGFLVHFAYGGLLRCLAFFDMAFWQTPFQMSGSGMPRNNGHSALIVENQAASGILAYHWQFTGVQRSKGGWLRLLFGHNCRRRPWRSGAVGDFAHIDLRLSKFNLSLW